MNVWKFRTKVLILVTGLIWAVYDAVVYCVAGSEATISRVVLGESFARPIFAFVVGVVCGHLFWPQPVPQETKPIMLIGDYTFEIKENT